MKATPGKPSEETPTAAPGGEGSGPLAGRRRWSGSFLGRNLEAGSRAEWLHSNPNLPRVSSFQQFVEVLPRKDGNLPKRRVSLHDLQLWQIKGKN